MYIYTCIYVYIHTYVYIYTYIYIYIIQETTCTHTPVVVSLYQCLCGVSVCVYTNVNMHVRPSASVSLRS